MNTSEEQIEIISKVINSTKENLKPLSVNFIFWGSLIVGMSLTHYIFIIHVFISERWFFSIEH